MADRKLLVESMLTEPIHVDYQDYDESHPEDGPVGPIADYKLHINPQIIKRFIDEGKIKRLWQDSSDYNASAYS